MRICVVVSQRALQDRATVEALARRNFALQLGGHELVAVEIVPNSAAQSKAFDLFPDGVHKVSKDETEVGELSMLPTACPNMFGVTQKSLAVWQLIQKLHAGMNFDLIEGFVDGSELLLPAFIGIVPVFMHINENQLAFRKPKSFFEAQSFDEQICGMLERMAWSAATALLIDNLELEGKIKSELGNSQVPILYMADASNSNSIAAYEKMKAVLTERSAARRFYLKSSDFVMGDVVTLINAFDQMIYNYLYQNSYRFRFYHWWQMLKSRPERFSKKFTLAALRPLAQSTKSRALSDKITEIEEQLVSTR